MPKITFVIPDGTRLEVDAPVGLSVLEVAHSHHIDLEGACEGSLACSTCHVIVEQGDESLSPMEKDEEDRLYRVPNLSVHSRLACRAVVRGDVVARVAGTAEAAPKPSA